MDIEQLRQNVRFLRSATNAGRDAYSVLDGLLCQIEQRIDPENPLNLPISQEQVNQLLAIYTPLWFAALPAVEAAGDALGTDNF